MTEIAHHEIVKSIRGIHSEIDRRMSSMSTEALDWHWRKAKWVKQALPSDWLKKKWPNGGPSLMELGPTIETLKKAGVPKELTDYLNHPVLKRLQEDSLTRADITNKIMSSLKKIEKNPSSNKAEVNNILTLFREAEENVTQAHKDGAYESALNRLSTVMEAMGILAVDKKQLQSSPELDDAWLTLLTLREHCRSACHRHMVWLEPRGEMKEMVRELAQHSSINNLNELDPSLFEVADQMSLQGYSPIYKPKLISQRAKELVRSISNK